MDNLLNRPDELHDEFLRLLDGVVDRLRLKAAPHIEAGCLGRELRSAIARGLLFLGFLHRSDGHQNLLVQGSVVLAAQQR